MNVMFSHNVAYELFTDTRYGTAEYHRNRFQEITGKKIIHEITTAEEIGPKMFDVLL